MCKHYNTPQGCSYGAKCQFAHGPAELRTYTGPKTPIQNMASAHPKNPLNYKIVKCKNWEKDGTCKYGDHCTFAHGDTDMRNKTDNIYQMQSMSMVMPMFYGMDMSQMPQMMPDMSQMMGGVIPGADPNQIMMGMNMNQNMNNQQMAFDGNSPQNNPNSLDKKTESKNE